MRGCHLLVEADAAGATLREYVWLDDLPLAVVADVNTATPNLYFVHADQLKRPLKMTDLNKAVVWDAVYRPFGEIVSITGSATNNLRFPGQYFLIEDGLHYNWHRQYEPTLGRYTRADPLGFRGGSSLYQYAFSNPLNFIDSTGLNPSFGSCFEECLLQHLGLTSAVAISGVGATPLYKPWLNLPVVGPGASRFTNVLSYIGLKLFPGATVGRQILGSARLFGILGRANIATGSALLTIDLLQIGLCIDECLDRPDCAR